MLIKLLFDIRKVFFLASSFFLLSSNYLIASQFRSFAADVNGFVLIYQIELVKDSFLQHEPVNVEIWIKNTSERKIIPNYSLLKGWSIRDTAGKEYPCHPAGYRASTAINPDDSTGGIIGLNQWGIPYKTGERYFPEGIYILSYRLFGDSVPPLTFSVAKPQGDEAKALELYLKSFPDTNREDIVKLPREDFKKRYNERITALLTLVDRFPKSVYATRALSLAASFAWNVVDRELSYRLYLRLLTEYSDANGYALKLVEDYHVDKKDSKGFRRDLENIIINSSDTNVVMRAKRRLKELDSEMW